MTHKAGFVNIVGNPNVGKSTLLNLMVSERLSIITSKAQTTRQRILGIVNQDDYQIVFSDTPGIIKPAYKMQEAMMGYVNTAIGDADILIYITDVVETWDKNEAYIEKLNKLQIPVIMLINKIDLSSGPKVKELIETIKQKLPTVEIIPISALENFNVEKVFNRIIELLPEAPPYYDKDALTDKPERFFIAEILREKILLNYRKEIPYSVEVEVEEFKESEKIVHIRALIHVSRETQKGIIIGNKGAALKKTNSQARIDMEKFLAKKVFLEVFVKVSKDWREKATDLKRFGYQM